MPDIEHSTLSGAELHEPKGIGSANADEAYVADGTGSGNWTPVMQDYVITGLIADVSNSETVYVALPYAGTVQKVVTVLQGSITTSDATITVTNSNTLSMGTITVTQSGSAAGDVDTLTPVSNNTVTDNDYLTIETDGASATSNKLWFSIVVRIT